MKRHLSDSEPEVADNCDDYEECSSPDTAQVVSRKKRRGIIEKRRRDRINSCLMELRRLVPAAFEKQGSAKLEKAEILQMTVDHLRHLHQTRDPRGLTDPYSAYSNTRAFLDYRIMGFRECVAEVARYLTSVEGLDMKDPLRVRALNHLENYLAQRELAINAAVAASAQMGMPKLQPVVVNASNMPATSLPYAPLTPPRASPDHLSPPASFAETPLPRFNLAFPNPIISFASTSTVPIFGAAPSSFKPVMPTAAAIVNSTPLVMIPKTERTELLSPIDEKTATTTTTKAPFRPWADTDNKS